MGEPDRGPRSRRGEPNGQNGKFFMRMELTTPAPGAPDPGVTLADAPAAPARSNRRELVRLFLVLLALSFVLRMPAFFTPVFNSDETFLATQAHVLGDGGQLYEDAIDRKPPIVPYVYAATFAFFETTALWSVRVVAMPAAILFARGGRGFLAGVAIALATLAKQTGAATLLPVLYLIARSRGKRGVGEVALGLTIATAL